MADRQEAYHSCRYCSYSMPLNGADKPTIICANKAGEEGEWWQVKKSGVCGNFGNNGHAPGKIEEALAEGAKIIGLSQGKVAIVDSADYEDLGQYKWCAIKGDSTYYAARRNGKKMVRMHREIMNAPPERLVDHRDHNGLDNRKSKLRICTRAENTRNQRLHKRGSTGYKGVSRHKKQKIFHAYIGYNSKKIWLGRFKKAKDAAKAYDKKAIELFGEFACLNFPEDFGLLNDAR